MPLRVNRTTVAISCVRESLLIDGQFMAISKYFTYPDWAMEFVRIACSKHAMVRSYRTPTQIVSVAATTALTTSCSSPGG